MIKTTVMPNCYMDSILILSVSREMMKLPTVKKAVVVMATDMNKTFVDEFGGMTAAVKSAGSNDLGMGCSLASMRSIKGKEYCTIVTSIAQNGVETGGQIGAGAARYPTDHYVKAAYAFLDKYAK